MKSKINVNQIKHQEKKNKKLKIGTNEEEKKTKRIKPISKNSKFIMAKCV